MRYVDAYKRLSELVVAEGVTELGQGDIDEVGEEESGYGPRTVRGHVIADLQTLLDNLLPSTTVVPDGGYGSRTARALKEVAGEERYQRQTVLPLLVERTTDGLLAELREQPGSTSSASAVSKDTYLELMPPHYCQADPRWAERTLGANRVFRRAGCAVTSCAMVLEQLSGGKQVLPSALDDFLDNNGGYVKGSDSLIWDCISRYAKEVLGLDVKHQRIQKRPDQELHRRAAEILSEGRPCMLRVRYIGNDYGCWFNHFVVGVGELADGNLRFFDPGYRAGGDLDAEENTTRQTSRKGGYEVVALEDFQPGI